MHRSFFLLFPRQCVVASVLASATIATSLSAQSLGPLRGHSGTIQTLAYAPDGHTLVSAGADRSLRFWRFHKELVDDAERDRRQQLLEDVNHPHFAVRQNAFDELKLLGPEIKPALLNQLKRPASTEAWMRTQTLVAMANVPEGKGHNREVRAIAISPDGKTVVSAGGDPLIGVWDLATGHVDKVLDGHDDGTWCVAFSSDGNRIATGGGDHRIRIWDAKQRILLREFASHESTVHDIAFSSDDSQLFSAGGFDRTVRVWSLETGCCTGVFSDHADAVMCFAISPDEKRIACGGYGGVLYVWDLSLGKRSRSFPAHEGNIRDLAFAPDCNSMLVSVGDDRMVKQWDIQDGGKRPIEKQLRSGQRAIAFAPDGQSFATAGHDGVIYRWPVETPSRE